MILLITGLFFMCQVKAQVASFPTPASDTTTEIEIIYAETLRTITLADGTELQTLAGNSAVRQGNTKLTGDSIILNQRTGIAEVFGRVHINDADTVNTYASYLKYLGKERIAYLKKNVKLTDGSGTLLTDDLEYNLATGIATYKGGGRVINGKTVLTSSDAVYYSDTKDVYFKKYVHLTDPQYDIVADSLLYNTFYKTATFISPTRIKTREGGIINTKSGTYNLQTREAIFYDRTAYSDSTRSLTGGKIAFDEKSGLLQVEENGKLVDSLNKVTVLANQILVDKNKNSFLATRKPVMILYRDDDSTYVSADTLFSGLQKYDSSVRTTSLVNKAPAGTSADTAAAATNPSRLNQGKINPGIKMLNPGTKLKPSDSIVAKTDSPKMNAEDTITVIDTTKKITDSTALQKTATASKKDSVQKINVKEPNDSIRYFLAFHHVRIFNDSLQAVCDSLFYSTIDSVFRLFTEPVVWNGHSQLNGDTIYLFTLNQKPERLFVFNNSMVINETPEKFYNQMAGRTLNGFFKEGNLDSIRVKGSPAESIYYMQDEDSAYIGMNRSSGDVIDIFFKNKELDKVKFINDVNGTLFPLKKIPAGKERLEGYQWLDARRPKNKLELFE